MNLQSSQLKKKFNILFSLINCRHIKLHDLPEERFPCPESGCSLEVSRINNLIRHLRSVHHSKDPYMCKVCGARFPKSAKLREHFASHREERQEKRKAQREANYEKEMREEQNEERVYACEFPGMTS